MPMYNLIEYSDNYADSCGSLYQFKRDESPINDAENPLNVALDNSTSFKPSIFFFVFQHQHQILQQLILMGLKHF